MCELYELYELYEVLIWKYAKNVSCFDRYGSHVQDSQELIRRILRSDRCASSPPQKKVPDLRISNIICLKGFCVLLELFEIIWLIWKYAKNVSCFDRYGSKNRPSSPQSEKNLGEVFAAASGGFYPQKQIEQTEEDAHRTTIGPPIRMHVWESV